MLDDQTPKREYEYDTVVTPRERREYSNTVVTETRRDMTPLAILALILATVAIAIALAVLVSEYRQSEPSVAVSETMPTPQPSQPVVVAPPPPAQSAPLPAAAAAPTVTTKPAEASSLIDDIKLEEQVQEKLLQTPELAHAVINAKVRGGQVTLSGEVEHPSMKALAEQLVKQVKGITKVINEITIE
jgi:hypothetical protein